MIVPVGEGTAPEFGREQHLVTYDGLVIVTFRWRSARQHRRAARMRESGITDFRALEKIH